MFTLIPIIYNPFPALTFPFPSFPLPCLFSPSPPFPLFDSPYLCLSFNLPFAFLYSIAPLLFSFPFFSTFLFYSSYYALLSLYPCHSLSPFQSYSKSPSLSDHQTPPSSNFNKFGADQTIMGNNILRANFFD